MPDRSNKATYRVWKAPENLSEKSWKDVIENILHKNKHAKESICILVTTKGMKNWAEEKVESAGLSDQVYVELHRNGEQSYPNYA